MQDRRDFNHHNVNLTCYRTSYKQLVNKPVYLSCTTVGIIRKHMNAKYARTLRTGSGNREREQEKDLKDLGKDLQQKLWDRKGKLGIRDSDCKRQEPFEAGCEMAWCLHRGQSDATAHGRWKGEMHTNITPPVQTIKNVHTHVIHTLSSSVMGVLVLAINALIKKTEAAGKKSCFSLPCTHTHADRCAWPGCRGLLNLAHTHCFENTLGMWRFQFPILTVTILIDLWVN